MRERILLNDDRETKHRSRLIPKDVMRVIPFSQCSQTLKYCAGKVSTKASLID